MFCDIIGLSPKGKIPPKRNDKTSSNSTLFSADDSFATFVVNGTADVVYVFSWKISYENQEPTSTTKH